MVCPEGKLSVISGLVSSKSSSRKILSLAAMPFMAIWKKEPSCRMGIKKSAASRIISRHPSRETPPLWYWVTAMMTPSAAPPYAIRSIMVMEFNCMVSTFMVIFRNFSACSFISCCLNASA